MKIGSRHIYWAWYESPAKNLQYDPWFSSRFDICHYHVARQLYLWVTGRKVYPLPTNKQRLTLKSWINILNYEVLLWERPSSIYTKNKHIMTTFTIINRFYYLYQGSKTYSTRATRGRPSNFQWHAAANDMMKSEQITTTTRRRYLAISISIYTKV